MTTTQETQSADRGVLETRVMAHLPLKSRPPTSPIISCTALPGFALREVKKEREEAREVGRNLKKDEMKVH